MSGDPTDQEVAASVARNKAYWRSRRGMQELDVLLLPFVREAYDDLSAELQAAYHDFLDSEDWALFDWLQGRAEPEREDFRALLARILAHRR
ncbi:MAG: succinate dehydrogenase assembly factor 2 [Pseudomonadota bacterium]